MRQIEFDTELHDKPFIAVPLEIAARLPKSGHVKVILLLVDDSEDEEWRAVGYEHFIREDSPEDSVYAKYA